MGLFSLEAASQTGAVTPDIRSIVAVTVSFSALDPFLFSCRLSPVASIPLTLTCKSHADVESAYLVMFSGLDGLERTDPVLHLFPVLGTEDEPTEWSDHLEG